MEVKLYIGNLQFETTDQDVQNPFASEGMLISAKVMADRFTGRSRGLAFVEMSTPKEAERANNALHGADVGRRILVANETSPLEEKTPVQLSAREIITSPFRIPPSGHLGSIFTRKILSVGLATPVGLLPQIDPI